MVTLLMEISVIGGNNKITYLTPVDTTLYVL